MPTNCKGQDKPGQSRGYQVTKDRDRGARGSPGREGRGAGGEGLHPLPDPACPQAGSRAQQPKLGILQLTGAVPAPDSRPDVCAWGLPAAAGWLPCLGGVRVAVAMAKQSLVSVGGQLQKLPWCVSVAFLPSLLGATPTAPEGTTAVPLCSPRPQNPFASTLSWFPSTVERINSEAEDDPRAPGAIELRAASTAGMFRFSLPIFKHEAVLLNVAIWAALVPRKQSRPGGGQQGCASLWDIPKPGRPQSPALWPHGAW